MAQKLRRSTCMDYRLRECMIGRRRHYAALPTLAQRDGDDTTPSDSHTVHDTSAEGELHPVLFDSEDSRVRLGLDPLPA